VQLHTSLGLPHFELGSPREDLCEQTPVAAIEMLQNKHGGGQIARETAQNRRERVQTAGRRCNSHDLKWCVRGLAGLASRTHTRL
jgi:hypothetical protein